MAGLFERMGLVRTEYEGMPEIPMQPVSEPMYAPETPVIDAAQVSYGRQWQHEDGCRSRFCRCLPEP